MPRCHRPAPRRKIFIYVTTNIPQALSAPIAAVIIGGLGGYSMVFVFAIIFVSLGAVAIAPIKGVR